MEPIKYVPLYFMAMPHSIVIIIEILFITTLAHIVDGVKSRPQTPKGTNFLSLHEDIPTIVNKVFVNKPLDLKGGNSETYDAKIINMFSFTFKNIVFTLVEIG
jgi:hypothetical protein